MPRLCFIIGRDNFLPVFPPVVPAVVTGRFDLQDGCPAVRQGGQIIQVSQHKRIIRMKEHLFLLVYRQPGLSGKNLCDQILQKVTDLQRYPVVRLILPARYPCLFIVDIPSGMKGRDPEYGSYIAAADPFPPVIQPFFPGQGGGIHKDTGGISFSGIIHGASSPLVPGGNTAVWPANSADGSGRPSVSSFAPGF